MPTMITESTALPNVRSAGIRPAWNQMAAVVSIPLPLDSCRSRSCPAPVTSPAASNTMMWRHGPACCAAPKMSVPEPAHARRWTTSSSRVSAAALTPVPIPVRTTASQKSTAPGRRSVEGIMSRGLVDYAPGLIRIVPGYGWSGSASYRLDVFLKNHTVLVHDECLDPGDSILRRPSHQPKTTHKLTLHQVTARAARRVRTLPVENPEVIPVIRLRRLFWTVPC